MKLVEQASEWTIPLDLATGAPDRATYELARRLELGAAHVSLMPASVRHLAERLVRAKRRALAEAWDHAHYRTLSNVRYTEPVANGYVDRPLRDYIENERFRHPHWWETFAKFAEFEDFAEGRPPGPAPADHRAHQPQSARVPIRPRGRARDLLARGPHRARDHARA